MSVEIAGMRYIACTLLAMLVFAPLAWAKDDVKDETYNMPNSVVAKMGVDAAMKKMETAVAPDKFDAFKKAHPAPFLLFGEDRKLAVRNNIAPAYWFEQGAKQFGQFAGVARPGEFYVFQAVVIVGDKPLRLAAGTEIQDAEAKILSPSSASLSVAAGEVKPLWIGVEIPKDAKPGELKGTVKIGASSGDEKVVAQTLAFTLKIKGEPIVESGVNDAWRLARLKWLDSKIGESDTEVTRPFTAIRADESTRTLDILGRRLMLGENGVPAQFTSFFSASNTKILAQGRDAFAGAPYFEAVIGGQTVVLKASEFRFTKLSPVGAEWEAVNAAGKLRFLVKGRLEFDGYLHLEIVPDAKETTAADEVRFVVPFAPGVAKYAMGLGLKGGFAPQNLDWKWDVQKNQDALWLGDTNLGVMLRFKGGNYRRPLVNAYYAFAPLNLPESWGGGGGVRLERGVLTAYSGKIAHADPSQQRAPAFNLDWYFTPFKPLAVADHFKDRYYHASQKAPLEDTKKLHAEGARIVEIHHNRLCNPYINYPFNDDSFGHLKDFIKKAHGDDMRVNVYYTTRELTQNLPELFALRSMDGEIILKRKDGVAWPVTNRNGPHPWLAQHVGEDIVPAWHENLVFKEYQAKLDLAMITTPDSRWNNFFLEGLDYLVKKAGIDGIYIDDTALNRESMQRARRILDADGNTSRRVSMHSWNHYNDLAGWANSSITFMELYPYYDGLWHGEGFDANGSPEYMLIEMSGIPYGLMSEMLDKPNVWHGMVFGMRTRWSWSGGDPRALWKLEDDFGIANSEFIGWWDKANPVQAEKTDAENNARVIASIYKQPGKTLVALGNWGKATRVKLTIDFKALGLDPAKAKLRAPAIDNIQSERTFALDDILPVEENRGLLLIVE